MEREKLNIEDEEVLIESCFSSLPLFFRNRERNQIHDCVIKSTRHRIGRVK